MIKNLFSKFANEGDCLFRKYKILKSKDIHLFYVSLYMFRILKIKECPTLQSDSNLKYRVMGRVMGINNN